MRKVIIKELNTVPELQDILDYNSLSDVKIISGPRNRELTASEERGEYYVYDGYSRSYFIDTYSPDPKAEKKLMTLTIKLSRYMNEERPSLLYNGQLSYIDGVFVSKANPEDMKVLVQTTSRTNSREAVLNHLSAYGDMFIIIILASYSGWSEDEFKNQVFSPNQGHLTLDQVKNYITRTGRRITKASSVLLLPGAVQYRAKEGSHNIIVRIRAI